MRPVVKPATVRERRQIIRKREPDDDEDDDSIDGPREQPSDAFPEVDALVALAEGVQLRHGEQGLGGQVLLAQAEEEDREGGEGRVVGRERPGLVQRRARVAGEALELRLHDVEDPFFPEGAEYVFACSEAGIIIVQLI